MKQRYWIYLFLSLVLLAGCSGEKSHAKKLILDSFPKSTAVIFGEFTMLDETRGCYQINAKNYRGQELSIFFALSKEKASDQEWSSWISTQSLEECRNATNK